MDVAGIATDVPIGSLSILIDRSALGRRGRGIFFQPANQISAQDVNLMARHGRGVIGAALTAHRAFALGLSPLATNHSRENAPRYMASVEAKACSETGISAAERAMTLRALGATSTTAADLVSPGHIMPAIVPERAGQVAGLEAIAFHYAVRSNEALAIAWCDILDSGGDVAGWAGCAELSDSLGLPLLVRMGDAAIAAEIVHLSGQAPIINVNSGGLGLGQFA
jgi:3,4-dihydroxy 2-butanone 4-phosphate synthase / GTP cyclohydrolase II